MPKPSPSTMSLKAFAHVGPAYGQSFIATHPDYLQELIDKPVFFSRTCSEKATAVQPQTTTLRRSKPDFILQSLCLCGLQVVWSVQLSNCAPYLTRLGVKSSSIPLVMATVPLAGVIVPPILGNIVDRSELSSLQHKLLILLSAVFVGIISFALSSVEELVNCLAGWSHTTNHLSSKPLWTTGVSFALVSLLGIAAVSVQTLSRILIARCTPTDQREQAATWTTRLTCVGGVFGQIMALYLLRQLENTSITEQYSALCTLASASVIVGCLLSMLSSNNATILENSIKGLPSPESNSHFRSITRIQSLSQPIKSLCCIQFFNWMAYFPIMYFSTAYISQLQGQNFKKGAAESSASLKKQQTLVPGTTMLLLQAITTLLGTVLVPFTVKPFQPDPNSSLHKLPSSRAKMLPLFTHKQVLLLAQMALFAALVTLSLTSEVMTAMVVTACIGLPFSVIMWSPFAQVMVHISGDTPIERHGGFVDGGEAGCESGEMRRDQGAGTVLGVFNASISAAQVVSGFAAWALATATAASGSQLHGGDGGSVRWAFVAGVIPCLVAAWYTYRS